MLLQYGRDRGDQPYYDGTEQVGRTIGIICITKAEQKRGTAQKRWNYLRIDSENAG